MLYNSTKLLGESNKVLVIGIHVCQLKVNQQNQLLFAFLLALSNVGADYSFGHFTQSWVAVHLKIFVEIRNMKLFCWRNMFIPFQRTF